MITTTDTAADIRAAILDALADGEPRPWAELRHTLPGRDNWQRAQVLTALVFAGQVHAVKLGGATLVALPLHLAAVPAA